MPLAREIVKALQGHQRPGDGEPGHCRAAEDRVARGNAAAAIIIPRDFSDKIDAYTPTAIEVIVDPAQPESTSIVTGIMKEVVSEVTIWGEVQYGIRSVFNETRPAGQRQP